MTIEELHKAFTEAMDEMIEANANTARKWAGTVGPLIEQAADAGIDEEIILSLVTIQKKRAEAAAEALEKELTGG